MSTVPPKVVLDRITSLLEHVVKLQEKGMTADAEFLLKEINHMTTELDKNQTLTYLL
jgi:hypothetical protein